MEGSPQNQGLVLPTPKERWLLNIYHLTPEFSRFAPKFDYMEIYIKRCFTKLSRIVRNFSQYFKEN